MSCEEDRNRFESKPEVTKRTTSEKFKNTYPNEIKSEFINR